MGKIALYLIGPAAGLLIFIIGVVIDLITGSEVDPIAVLKLALGIALVTEFVVALSVIEEAETKRQE